MGKAQKLKKLRKVLGVRAEKETVYQMTKNNNLVTGGARKGYLIAKASLLSKR